MLWMWVYDDAQHLILAVSLICRLVCSILWCRMHAIGNVSYILKLRAFCSTFCLAGDEVHGFLMGGFFMHRKQKKLPVSCSKLVVIHSCVAPTERSSYDLCRVSNWRLMVSVFHLLLFPVSQHKEKKSSGEMGFSRRMRVVSLCLEIMGRPGLRSLVFSQNFNDIVFAFTFRWRLR